MDKRTSRFGPAVHRLVSCSLFTSNPFTQRCTVRRHGALQQTDTVSSFLPSQTVSASSSLGNGQLLHQATKHKDRYFTLRGNWTVRCVSGALSMPRWRLSYARNNSPCSRTRISANGSLRHHHSSEPDFIGSDVAEDSIVISVYGATVWYEDVWIQLARRRR
jgi:hypothetical protein